MFLCVVFFIMSRVHSFYSVISRLVNNVFIKCATRKTMIIDPNTEHKNVFKPSKTQQPMLYFKPVHASGGKRKQKPAEEEPAILRWSCQQNISGGWIQMVLCRDGLVIPMSFGRPNHACGTTGPARNIGDRWPLDVSSTRGTLFIPADSTDSTQISVRPTAASSSLQACNPQRKPRSLSSTCATLSGDSRLTRRVSTLLPVALMPVVITKISR